MAGRHSLIAPSATFVSKGRLGLLTATAAGAIVGIGMPVASANPQNVSADSAANAVSVENRSAVSQAVAVETPAVANASVSAPAIELEASTGAEWQLATIELDAQAAPVVEEPVAVDTQATGAAAETSATTNGATATQATQTQATQTQATQQAQAPAAKAQAAAPATAGGYSNVVAIARQYSGAPYVSGGTTPAGWDCSGFTSYVYAQAGVSLPRTSGAQLNAGYRVSASEARPGDLVWWPGHVGIYTGNGQHIAARNPSAGTAEGPVYGNPVYVRIGG